MVFNNLDVNNTAYNFYTPAHDQNFVITILDMVADKSVSSTVSATIVVYEASSAESTTVDKVLYQTAMVEGQQKTINVNLLVNKGKFINAKTTDDNIHMNIFGYYL